MQTMKRRESFQAAEGHFEDFRFLIGIVIRVRRCVEAYFRLEKSGYSAEGEMLVRAAVEHAVSGQWAFLVNGGMTELRNSADKSQVAILKVYHDAMPDPDFQRRYEEAKSQLEGPFLPAFSRENGILKQLGADFLDLSYRVLSQRVHVTSKTLVDAFEVSADSRRLEVVDVPKGENQYEAVTCLAASGVFVSWIIARVLGDEAELARIQSLASSLNLTYRLDLGLPPARRRFPDESM